jgi:hypothetical protein
VSITQARRRDDARPVLADLAALRRYLWLPVATVLAALAVATILTLTHSASDEARFRMTVVVDALPPLFGPPVLPGPVEYSGLARSDPTILALSQRTGIGVEELQRRVSASPRFNRPEVDFAVTGPDPLPVARAWAQVITEAAPARSAEIEKVLAQPYTRQLDEARSALQAQATAAAAAPDDAVAQQQFKAAQENFETASRLAQSYDVVARTMNVRMLTSDAPHNTSSGVGSTAGRFGAAIAAGLLVGVLGALALDFARNRRAPVLGPSDESVATLRPRASGERGGAR